MFILIFFKFKYRLEEQHKKDASTITTTNNDIVKNDSNNKSIQTNFNEKIIKKSFLSFETFE